MGFLCAVTLGAASLPPSAIEGVIGASSRSWSGCWPTSSPDSVTGWTISRALAEPSSKSWHTMLSNLAIVQKLRLNDYVELALVLALAAEAELPLHPLRTAATDRILALNDAMALVDNPGGQNQAF